MPWRESACVQVRASAIWPTAAEAWLSSSRSGPFGNLSTARPSAIAPEDTTSTSRLAPCSHATSSVSEASQSSFTREAEASTISEEPTFTTMRRKSMRLGILAAIGLESSVWARSITLAPSVDDDLWLPGCFRRPRRLLVVWPRLVDLLDQRAQHLRHARAGRSRDHERRAPGRALEAGDLLFQRFRRERIGFVERDHFGFLCEAAAIGLELRPHGLVGLAGMLAGAVDEMQEDAAALDMTEEAVAEARAFVRAFDQTRNIGEHELALVDRDHAELRMQRGERIVGDLRPRRAHGGKEGRLAGIREPDDAGVSDQLQAQPDRALLARLARIGVARRAVGRGLEVRVAEAAVAAFGEHRALAHLGEIGEQRLTVLLVDLGADRNLHHNVGAVRAMAILAHAATAVLGGVVLLIAVVDQRVEALDGERHHVATLAAVAAVGPAELDEFLAPERHAAVPAVTGADVDLGFVEEFHDGRNMRPPKREWETTMLVNFISAPPAASKVRSWRFLRHAGFPQSFNRPVDIGLLEAEFRVLDRCLFQVEARIELEQLCHRGAGIFHLTELPIGVCELDLIPPPVRQVHVLEFDQSFPVLAFAVVILAECRMPPARIDLRIERNRLPDHWNAFVPAAGEGEPVANIAQQEGLVRVERERALGLGVEDLQITQQISCARHRKPRYRVGGRERDRTAGSVKRELARIHAGPLVHILRVLEGVHPGQHGPRSGIVRLGFDGGFETAAAGEMSLCREARKHHLVCADCAFVSAQGMRWLSARLIELLSRDRAC